METEGIKIKFDDGTEYRLPDISYEKFIEHMFKSGSSDVEYDKYCRENNMADLTDFNGESTSEITLIVEQPYRGRVLKFRCVYDSDDDGNYNPNYKMDIFENLTKVDDKDIGYFLVPSTYPWEMLSFNDNKLTLTRHRSLAIWFENEKLANNFIKENKEIMDIIVPKTYRGITYDGYPIIWHPIKLEYKGGIKG